MSVQIYGITLIVCNVSMLGYLTYFLPFHRKRVNIFLGTGFVVSTVASVIAYSSQSVKSGYGPLIALLIVGIGSGIGGKRTTFNSPNISKAFFAFRWYVNLRYRPTLEGEKREFKKDFLVEISTRHGYYS